MITERNSMDTKKVSDEFTRLYFDSHVWQNTHWMGKACFKPVSDLWSYQEIIFETKPDLIIECGTAQGGSALFYASICELMRNGHIISIGLEHPSLVHPVHQRLTYVVGDSIAEATINYIKQSINSGQFKRIMVSLDSDHKKEHVAKEIALYSPFVTKDCYLVVEDGCVNGHPILPDFGLGPSEAIAEFLKNNNQFIVDKSREKFFLTFHPNGYLKRVG